jgi:hypothetical protein
MKNLVEVLRNRSTYGFAVAGVMLILTSLQSALEAMPSEVATVAVVQGALDQVTNSIFPIPLALDGTQTLWIVYGRYLGLNTSSRPRVIAIGVPGSTPPALKPIAITPELSLQDVADKALAANSSVGWVLAVELTGEWIPWKLSVSISNIAISAGAAATNRPSAENLARAKGVSLVSYDTSNIPLVIQGKSLAFNIAIRSGTDHVELALVPSVAADKWSVSSVSPLQASLSGPFPSYTNTIASIESDFLKSMLSEVYGQQEFSLVSAADGSPEISVRDVSVETGVDTITTRAAMHYVPGDLDSDVQLDWQGDDLKLSKIQVFPHLQNCNGLNFVAKAKCEAQNVAMQTGADAVASYLSKTLTGHLLRPLSPAQAVPFSLDGVRLSLQAKIERISSSPDHIVCWASIGVYRQ